MEVLKIKLYVHLLKNFNFDNFARVMDIDVFENLVFVLDEFQKEKLQNEDFNDLWNRILKKIILENYDLISYHSESLRSFY